MNKIIGKTIGLFFAGVTVLTIYIIIKKIFIFLGVTVNVDYLSVIGLFIATNIIMESLKKILTIK